VARIVVVEDSAYMRNMICAIAVDAGHEVVAVAADGVEGRAAVLDHDPDCVVSDLLMPRCGGLEMIRGLHEDGWNGPVVVLTADIQKSTAEHCEAEGVFQFLHKPPDQEQLQGALAAANARAF